MRKLKIANVNKKHKKKNEKKKKQIIARLMIQPEHFFFFVYLISLNKYYSLMPHGAHEIYREPRIKSKAGKCCIFNMIALGL